MQLSSHLVRLASAIAIVIFNFMCIRSCCGSEAPVKLCKLGDCTDYLSCPILRSALSLAMSKSSIDVINTVKQHRCGVSESKSVCCTDLAADLIRNNILVNFTDEASAIGLAQLMTTPCGRSDGSDRIANGVTAFLFEFPWMALLEYSSAGGSRFLCAGTLISNRYVLTAAHCFISPDSQLVNVRLGEYDISKEIDCDRYGGGTIYCAPPVQNHQVEDVLIHKDFEAGLKNDIALIRLKNKVDFSGRISPICLPISKESLRILDRATVAGWTYGNSLDVLKKFNLSVVTIDICRQLFSRYLTSAQICVASREGVTACEGDFGGPLFTLDTRGPHRFIQYGVLSGVGRSCGNNNTVPSIYTNVVDHMPWIIGNLKP